MSSEKLKNIPNMNSLLKISMGLIIVAIISSAFVYAETTSVSIEGTSYDVEYTGIGVTVNGVDADLDFISLILLVDVSGTPGTLDITFDRSFFDSKYQGNDESFIVLADGDEPNYSEIETNSQSRTISIELPNGTEEVEIIGSVFGDSLEPPVEEPIVVEPPVKEPIVVEPPVKEPIVVEPPVKEAPQPSEKPTKEESKPKTECGPGTILKDGVCVVEPIQSSPSNVRGMGTELIMAVIASFIIAGAVGVVIALISKASKSRD